MNVMAGIKAAPADAAAAFDSGRLLLKEKRVEEAVAHLKQAVSANPRHVEARAALAKAYETLGNKPSAVDEWGAVARIGDDAALRKHRPLFRIAKHALQEDRINDCLAALEGHMRLVPDDQEASEKLLETRLTQLPVDARRPVYRAHVAAHGETSEIRILRATHITRFEFPEDASALVAQTETDLAQTRHGLLRLAKAYDVVGDPAKALGALERADADKPGDVKLAKMRLRILQQSGGSRNAILQALEAVIAAEPGTAAHWGLKGRLLAKFRDWSGSAEAYEAALAIDNQVPAYWEGAIGAYNQIEREDKADTLLAEAAAVLRGNGARGHIDLARIQIAGGLFREAEENAASALGDPEFGLEASAAVAEAIISSGDYVRGWTEARGVLREGGDLAIRRLAARCASSIRLAASDESQPGRLFARAILEPPATPAFPQSGPIMLVASSLGTGGAERQIAITSNLLARKRGGDTVLVGLNLDPASGRAVMRPLAETPELTIEDLGSADDMRLLRSMAADDPSKREAIRVITAFPRRVTRDIVRLYDCFHRHRPRLVHLWQDGVIATGSVAAALAGVPRIVASVRNVVAGESDRGRYKPYQTAMYQALAQRDGVTFTANADAGGRDYEAMMGVQNGTIRTVRNGIDVAAIRARATPEQVSAVRYKLGLKDGELVVGGVFRLTPPKRPLLWLEVVAGVARMVPEARFLHCGDGALRDEVAARAQQIGLGDRLILAGRQTPVEPWVALMDAMLLASEVEGLPNVLLEAQALGVPVVATEAGGSGEAMLDGVTGRLVRHDAPEAIASAVRDVVTDRGMRSRTRIGGPAFIEQRFGIERMLRDTLAAYGEGSTSSRVWSKP